MKVWKAFAQSRAVRVVCFVLAGMLLAASGFGLWYSLSAPSEVELPAVNYEHNGEFDYLVYLKPNSLYGQFVPAEEKEPEETEEAEERPLVFFRDIMEDDVTLAFSYKFDCSEATASVTNDVVVTITAENPGMWRKEVRRWEESHRAKEFRVAFPLRLESLEEMVDDIEEDIGVTTSQRQFIIKAVVHTTAVTREGEIIEDDFSHEITAILKEKTLELEGDLEQDYTALFEERISYREEGRFDYEVYLERNKLYEETVLRSESLPVAEPAEPPPSPPPPLQTVGPGLVYFPKILDSIEASFSYQFDCDKPLKQQSAEVEVTAIIENPDRWSKSLVLVSKTEKEGNFTIPFPIDIHYFNDVIDAIQGETGAGGGPYNVNIKADVHSIAQTDFGAIDEVYSQTLEMKLERNTLTFGEELTQSQSGSIGVVSMPADSKTRKLKMPSLGGLVAALLALGFLGWNQTQLKAAGIDVEAEAARAKKKYKQVIVDIEELPSAKPNETVIPLSSVDDLARIADDLVKPVLHQVKEGKHVYCIVDGVVRYQYVIQPQDSGFEDAP